MRPTFIPSNWTLCAMRLAVTKPFLPKTNWWSINVNIILLRISVSQVIVFLLRRVKITLIILQRNDCILLLKICQIGLKSIHFKKDIFSMTRIIGIYLKFISIYIDINNFFITTFFRHFIF